MNQGVKEDNTGRRYLVKVEEGKEESSERSPVNLAKRKLFNAEGEQGGVNLG
jgi:hypothetical protein